MERRKRRSPVEEYIDSLLDSPEKLERCTQFYQNLRGFYHRKWKCPLKAPYIQGVEVNLFHLYEIVNSLGGWQKVSAGEKWATVAQAIGIAEGVAVAEHAIKVLYMRYLSKYEQNETVGDVDDNEADLIGSRSRSKGFSSLANADCPISTSSRYTIDLYRGKTEKRSEPDYNRLVKSLYCGLPNEVDFAINVCTLLSHPGPRFLRLASAPQILTLLVAHVGVFSDDDDSMLDLYKSWEEASGHDFISFWKGAGIEDEEILALLPHVKPSKVSSVDLNLFGGLVHEFRLKDVVSWRVHQILSIVRNLSFEVINKPVMAASWPLMKFLFVCCDCKWSSLRTAALDALSNIASEIDLLCEESSGTNHLLLKTVSRCLHSGDKLQIIRALEILAGLCNNERNESLLCEFLDSRVLNKIFEILIVKDVMMCVYTLEALYQISELGAVACQQIALLPHAIEILVDLATVEAYSFGPSGLSGIKVVEFHGPPQLAPPPPQTASPMHGRYMSRQTAFATPAPPLTYHATARTAVAVHSPAVRVATVTAGSASGHTSLAPVVGESKVEQLTAKWLRLNCLSTPGNIIPRGELYATYVEDLRNHYNALSGSVQMFTNIIKALFPSVVVRVGTNTTSMVIENLKYAKGQGVATMESTVVPNVANSSVAMAPNTSNTMVASHPVMQKILLGNGTVSTPLINGHLGDYSDKGSVKTDSNSSAVQNTTTPVIVESSQANAHTLSVVSVHNKVCCAALEAKDFIPDDGRHEAKIVRVENTSHPSQVPSQVAVMPSKPGVAPVMVAVSVPTNAVTTAVNVSGVASNTTRNSTDTIASVLVTANSNADSLPVGNISNAAVAIAVASAPVSAVANSTGKNSGLIVSNSLGNVVSSAVAPAIGPVVSVTNAVSTSAIVTPNTTSVSSMGSSISNTLISTVATNAINGTITSVNVASNSQVSGPAVQNASVVIPATDNGNISPGTDMVTAVMTSQAENSSTLIVGESQSPPPIVSKSSIVADSGNLKNAVARRLNGIKGEKVEKLLNGDTQHNATQVVIMHQKVLTNGGTNVPRAEIKAESTVGNNHMPTVVIKDGINPAASTSTVCNEESATDGTKPATPANIVVPAKRRRTSRCSTPRMNEHTYSEKMVPSTSTDCGGDYMCEWNGCGRTFPTASFVLYHCAKDHVGDQATLQCHWPRCDSTVRTKLSMVTHLQDHHCSEALLLAATKRRKEGFGTVLGPVNPERPRDMHQHPGYAKNAAIEAIRRHAFTYLPREITDDSEGPVTKSIRLTSSLILRNLARYSTDGRRLIRHHETLLSWLASSRLESSSALSQLLGELYNSQATSS